MTLPLEHMIPMFAPVSLFSMCVLGRGTSPPFKKGANRSIFFFFMPPHSSGAVEAVPIELLLHIEHIELKM